MSWTTNRCFARWIPCCARRRSCFDASARRSRLSELSRLVLDQSTWSDPQRYALIKKEIKELEVILAPLSEIEDELSFLGELSALRDELLSHDIGRRLEALRARLASLLAFPDDDKAVFVGIRHGSGGAEARAWAAMLLRMYSLYASRQGLSAELMDSDLDDAGGVRSALLRVSGPGAFRLFRGESGIHRLSRVSPFDHANRRQTSFSQVEVFPDEPRVVAIDLKESEVDVWFCCGGGPGGQKINKTEIVAVVKHLPTGIMVRCQATRSQATNKDLAMGILRSKLLRKRKEREEVARLEIRREGRQATFGNRDRTYILSQGRLVHDHRTGRKTTEVERILDGELELLG